ncbi:MAG TPA: hypothetical protein VEA40_15745 [Ramlibacter sp.]|nr:hypothetical protein [Ramlibacter sp.]
MAHPIQLPQPPRRVRLWLHYCPVERTPLEVAQGQPCRCCGEREIGFDAEAASQSRRPVANDPSAGLTAA